MKSIILIFIITVLCSQCSAQKPNNRWKVVKVKTNYVQKGILDKYQLPLRLKDKEVQIHDSLLIVTDIRKNYTGSSLNDDFGDTILMKKKVLFKKRVDDQLSSLYPGDEFIECVQSGSDTCLASMAFFKLLESKGNDVFAYVSTPSKHSKTKCILFLVKENSKAVLYSENDFLLLFLTKQ